MFIRDQEGKSTTSLLGQDLIFDRRNSRLDPTAGYQSRVSTDVAGLGGDAQYFRAKIDNEYHYQISGQWVAHVTGSVGHMFDFGNEIKINDRYFAGGDSLRGFQDSGIGPRDASSSDALGGQTLALASVELNFPLGLPEELGFSGSFFSDAGTLFNPVDDGSSIQDDASLRLSTGIGLKWRSPLGPIRLDFALPIIKEDFDQTELVRFNLGTRF